MELYVAEKLVDVRNHNIIGYIVSNTTNKVAVTQHIVEQLGLGWAEFAECGSTECVTYNGKFGRVGMAIYYNEEENDVPYYKRTDGTIQIWGYIFMPYHLISLDNETAIKNCIIDADRDYEDDENDDIDE